MPTDDELLGLLAESLEATTGPEDGPPADRVAALRRAAEARRDDPGRPIDAGRSTRSVRPRRTVLILGAAAAVLVVAFIGGRQVGAPSSSQRQEAGVIEYDGSLDPPGADDGQASVRVEKTGIGRVITLDTDELPILPKGEYYELWFVGPDDASGKPSRISAGTFHPDPEGRSRVTFAAAVDPTLFPTLMVTAEPADGDPAATGPVVLEATIP